MANEIMKEKSTEERLEDAISLGAKYYGELLEAKKQIAKLQIVIDQKNKALKKISEIDCGCSPCTNLCRTGIGAEIELEERMELAYHALISY